jgi:hypothetical protein
MAHFLRDEFIRNVTVSEEMLSQLDAIFQARAAALNAEVPNEDADGRRIHYSSIIRFDNKGYRVFGLPQLLHYFRQARQIERLVISLESAASVRTNRVVGTYMELRLDQKDVNTCYLVVSADDADWVDAAFTVVREVTQRFRNRNGWARTAWTTFAVQVIGVSIGFFISLWAAIKIAPKLAIENAFVITFLFVLLIFSNTWTYLNNQILAYINQLFPNVRFARVGRERVHWIMQAIVGGIALAIVLFALNLIFSYFGDVLGSFIAK